MGYYDELSKHGNRVAAIQEDRKEITYDQLDQMCKEAGEYLPSRSLVFCFCENNIGSLCGYISCLYNRAVPLLLDVNSDAELIQNLLVTYQPQYLMMPAELAQQYQQCRKLWEIHGYYLMATESEKRVPLSEELGLLLNTSGSTGSSKLVRQSYDNIQKNAEAIAQYLELSSDERPITTLPMHYTYGLSIINSHLLVGATILMTTKPIIQSEFWAFFMEYEGTSFGGVPYTYEMLKRIRFFRMKLPSLRTLTQAGGKLDPELHKEFAEYALKEGKRFVVMYGQTEATARMSYLPYEKALEKYGSMGIAIPGGKFRLIDVNGNEIEGAEVVGELVYEGHNVTLGYATGVGDLSKGDEWFGVLKTGDMAKRDADGYYYVVGRKKRFLKLFGNRVNLDEIDRLVKRQFENLDCASVGTDEVMQVYITDAALIDEVKTFLVEKTHLNARAIAVEVIDEIPKNESGKTVYVTLKV